MVVSLSWDPFNQGRFISAQGGCITLWDTSMERTGIILKNSNNVQFVKYNNMRQEYIASGLQNGQIDLWDIRKPNQPFHNFQAHLKDVNCLDWHPTDDSVIISSGQNDRQIKVWNVRDDILTR